jgi:hypothetical protein
MKGNLSYRIFSLWQDVLLTDKFLKYEPQAYICNFLQRANSKELYQEWKTVKINFDSKVQRFGELLFSYGLPITLQTNESYVNASNELINSQEYNDLF